MPKKRNTDLLAALGARLQALRKARGWTQEQLAEALDLQPVTLSRVETGDRAISISLLADAARVLGVSLGDLVDVDRAEPEATDDPVVSEGVALLKSLDPMGLDLGVRLLREVSREPGKRRGGPRGR